MQLLWEPSTRSQNTTRSLKIAALCLRSIENWMAFTEPNSKTLNFINNTIYFWTHTHTHVEEKYWIMLITPFRKNTSHHYHTSCSPRRPWCVTLRLFAQLKQRCILHVSTALQCPARSAIRQRVSKKHKWFRQEIKRPENFSRITDVNIKANQWISRAKSPETHRNRLLWILGLNLHPILM